jgi:hypothetical protein
MSFGVGQSMISSIKNNLRGRKKTYLKRERSTTVKKGRTSSLLDKKATPEQIEAIRIRVLEEEKRKRKKSIIIALICFGVIILAVVIVNLFFLDEVTSLIDKK